MYVAVKGGERAIDAAHDWLADARRGDRDVPELTIDQIREQMAIAVARVMAEGSLYDPDLAALAIKQARGDMIEAVFLVRAYRTTLPRFGHSHPIDTASKIHAMKSQSDVFVYHFGYRGQNSWTVSIGAFGALSGTELAEPQAITVRADGSVEPKELVFVPKPAPQRTK